MKTNPHIIIAIDGFSSCGKSTLAKDLAKHLHYKYLDSGAMYRAVTLYCLQNSIDMENEDEIIKNLDHISIDFRNINGKNATFLNGKNVEEDIRKMNVSSKVSEVARIPDVRKRLVSLQRELGKSKGIVMDGRDITTVVFPDAELKLFVTADIDIRSQRRYMELTGKNYQVTMEEVKKNLAHRDQIDSNRKHSPLLQAEDAFLLDNSYLNREEQLQVALRFKAYVTGNMDH